MQLIKGVSVDGTRRGMGTQEWSKRSFNKKYFCRLKLDSLEYCKVSWTVADAQKLPFDDNSFSAYTIAFGIRNVTNIEKVLHEAYRVLQPGGRFLCLEFSHLENKGLQW